LPEAEASIAQLKEIDPEAVERANTFFPYAQFQGEKRDGSTDQDLAAAEAADTEPSNAMPAAETMATPANTVAETVGTSSDGSLTTMEKQADGRRSKWFYVLPILIAIGLVIRLLMSKRQHAVAATSESR
jgi:hypothetical protein